MSVGAQRLREQPDVILLDLAMPVADVRDHRRLRQIACDRQVHGERYRMPDAFQHLVHEIDLGGGRQVHARKER